MSNESEHNMQSEQVSTPGLITPWLILVPVRRDGNQYAECKQHEWWFEDAQPTKTLAGIQQHHRDYHEIANPWAYPWAHLERNTPTYFTLDCTEHTKAGAIAGGPLAHIYEQLEQHNKTHHADELPPRRPNLPCALEPVLPDRNPHPWLVTTRGHGDTATAECVEHGWYRFGKAYNVAPLVAEHAAELHTDSTAQGGTLHNTEETDSMASPTVAVARPADEGRRFSTEQDELHELMSWDGDALIAHLRAKPVNELAELIDRTQETRREHQRRTENTHTLEAVIRSVLHEAGNYLDAGSVAVAGSPERVDRGIR